MTKPQLYRDFIDRMADECRTGQGAVGPSRARSGIWNAEATTEQLENQHKINLLLKTLGSTQRETLAEMLAHAFQRGVFETLKALEDCDISPFQGGYEGSPYHDFIGRVDEPAWEWPDDE